MGVGLLLVFFVLFNGELFAKVTEESVNSPILNYLTYLSFIAIAITTIIAIIFPIINAFTHPKQAIKGLLLLLGFALIGFISYLLAKGDTAFTVQELARLNTTQSTVNLVGISMYFTYIMCAIAIIIASVSPVLGRLKKIKK